MRTVSITSPALVALVALAGCALGACAHEAKPAQAPQSGDGVTTTNAPTPAAPATQNAVSMSADLRHVCGIEDTGAAPKFGFDSAQLTPGDRSELDQLATCMTTGPLKGQNVSLVGRADPRGEAEYNMNLGATRATAVQSYLARLGVAGSRLTTTSRGALDAEGHDETTWAVDRRVDLDLATR
jgi:peptidoglycan-associated lipoprotein